ncbi:MAG: response regulator [Candidatus Liptonbacteria bacterium]|nr:response regulator [Candidatus Liptonbacteria bacterium]
MREKPLILVVDDEKNFQEIFSAKLKAAGFEVAVARNGKEAVAKAGELLPDLVLMDIHMPNETGTDVALEIKQNPKTKMLKVAFLTNLKEPWPAVAGDKATIAKELGMDDFLEKTDDLNHVVEKVNALLARKGPATPAEKRP